MKPPADAKTATTSNSSPEMIIFDLTLRSSSKML